MIFNEYLIGQKKKLSWITGYIYFHRRLVLFDTDYKSLKERATLGQDVEFTVVF